MNEREYEDTALSPQARQAAARADELHNSVYGNPGDKKPAPEEEGADQRKPGDEEEPPQFEAPRKDTAEYWQHRFQVLQGKYDAETRRMRGQIGQLEQEVRDLNARLEEARNFQARQEEDESGAPADWPQWAKDKLNDGMDFDTVDLAVTAWREGEGGRREEYQPPEREQQPDAQNDHQRAVQAVAELVGLERFKSVDEDPNFPKWLDVVEPGSEGRSRNDLMSEAFQAGNYEEVAVYFKAFDRERAARREQPSGIPSKRELETPPSGGHEGQGGEGERKAVLTRAEIQEHYRLAAMGKLTEEQEQAFEAKLAAANREGRIR